MLALDRPSWQNPKILTTLLMVFVAGAFTGALGMRWGLHQRMHPGSANTWKDPRTTKALLEQFQRELRLNPQQVAQMSGILDDYKQYYQSLQDQLDDVRGTGQRRIHEILTKEQQEKFEKMLAELPH